MGRGERECLNLKTERETVYFLCCGEVTSMLSHWRGPFYY